MDPANDSKGPIRIGRRVVPQGALALNIDISIHSKDLLLIHILEFAKKIRLRWVYICLHLNYYNLFKF